MDVKFPLTNYISYMNSDEDTLKDDYKKQFLKDVRQRVKEVTTRDYINPADNTLDYMIIFIPNEQVYSFINENDVISEITSANVITIPKLNKITSRASTGSGNFFCSSI